MPKKEKIPPPGNKKDEYTNFYSKAKWKQLMLKSTLDCNGRNMRAVGAQIVGNALAKNRWVTHIDFSHNHFSDQGAIELAQILKVNDIIQNVNLSCNDIGDIGGIALASAFIPCANPTGAPSQWNRSVYYLNLSGNQMGNDALVALCNAAAAHRDLTKVDLTYNRVGGAGTKAMMRSMSRNPLCTFMLGGNQLGDEGVQNLCAAVIQYGGKGSQAVFALFNNDVSKGGAEAIGSVLEQNDFITDLNLSWNTLGYKGTEALCTRMMPPAKNVLRVLNLANNCLGDEGAEEVAKVIESNIETLTRVNVSHNEIKDRGGVALANAVAKNTYVTYILATHNELGDKAVEAFCDTIKSTKTLKVLDFKRNNFTDDQKQKFSDALKYTESQGLRVDYGAMDDVVPMSQFLDKIKEYAEMHRQEEEKKGAKKGGKKSK